MKLHITLTGLLVVLAIFVRAQTLKEIFLLLPDETALADKEVRKDLVDAHLTRKNTVHQSGYQLKAFDERNGYIKMQGPFEGAWEMCYWNLADQKLVAVYHEGCGPVCYVENFTFYQYKDNVLVPRNTEDIIPGFNTLYGDFFIRYTPGVEDSLQGADVHATMLFTLPAKGKDILVRFGNNGPNELYTPYSKGNRMVLRWNGGSFIKDRIYWQPD